ncbi:hypothetical protein [Actinokineospora sp. NPDC004072]
MKRYQAAIAAGVDPSALVEVINQAQAEREAARADVGHQPTIGKLDVAEVYAMIDALRDVRVVLEDAQPEAWSTSIVTWGWNRLP